MSLLLGASRYNHAFLHEFVFIFNPVALIVYLSTTYTHHIFNLYDFLFHDQCIIVQLTTYTSILHDVTNTHGASKIP